MRIFRRQQSGYLGSTHFGDSSSDKLEEALKMEAHIKEAFSQLQNVGHHMKRSMRKGRQERAISYRKNMK